MARPRKRPCVAARSAGGFDRKPLREAACHASDIVSCGQGSGEDDLAALKGTGIRVSPSPSDLGTTLVEVPKRTAERSVLVEQFGSRHVRLTMQGFSEAISRNKLI